MDAERVLDVLAESCTDDEIDCIVAAMKAGCIMRRLGGKFYAFRQDGPGHWMWRCEPGSQEYYVTRDSCTCPARPKPCKHILAVHRGLGL